MEFHGSQRLCKMYKFGCDSGRKECQPIEDNIVTYSKLLNDKLFPTRWSPLSELKDVLREVASQNFENYASIMFIVAYVCDCDKYPALRQLCATIAENEQLRYLTKVFMIYEQNPAIIEHTNDNLHIDKWAAISSSASKISEINNSNSWSNMNDSNTIDVLNFAKTLNGELPFPRAILSLKKRDTAYVTIETEKEGRRNLSNLCSKYPDLAKIASEQQNEFNFDNCLIIECLNAKRNRNQRTLEEFPLMYFWDLLVMANTTCIQDLSQLHLSGITIFTHESSAHKFISHYSSTAGNYLFSINSALGIVINHFFYDGDKYNDRVGSDLDVANICRVLNLLNVPVLSVADASKNQVMAIMSKVKSITFSKLQYLFLFISGHGETGDIIVTKDDSYHIRKDVIDAIESNSRLKNTSVIIVVNACRGTKKPGDSDIDDSDSDDADDSAGNDSDGVDSDKESNEHFKNENENTDAAQNYMNVAELPKNVIIMFSTAKDYVSYRRPDIGSDMIMLLTQAFSRRFKSVSFRSIFNDIRQTMMRRYHPEPEFAEPNDGNVTNLAVEFDNFSEYRHFLNDWRNFAEENS